MSISLGSPIKNVKYHIILVVTVLHPGTGGGYHLPASCPPSTKEPVGMFCLGKMKKHFIGSQALVCMNVYVMNMPHTNRSPSRPNFAHW